MKKPIVILLIFLTSCNTFNAESEKKIVIKKKGGLLQILTYKKNELESLVSYKNDSITKEGEAIYFKNGKIDSFVNWNDGFLVGASIKYYNGIPSVFVCRSSYGDTIFLRKFKGRKIEFDSGSLLPHGLLDFDKKYQDSIINYVGFIVHPPYTYLNIDCYVINMKNRDTIKPFNHLIDYGWVHNFSFRLNYNQTYQVRRVVKIVDSLVSLNNIITAIDSQYFTIPCAGAGGAGTPPSSP